MNTKIVFAAGALVGAVFVGSAWSITSSGTDHGVDYDYCLSMGGNPVACDAQIRLRQRGIAEAEKADRELKAHPVAPVPESDVR